MDVFLIKANRKCQLKGDKTAWNDAKFREILAEKQIKKISEQYRPRNLFQS